MQSHGLDPQARSTGEPQPELVSFVLWLPALECRWSSQPGDPGGPAGVVARASGPDPAALRRAVSTHLERCGHPGAEPLRWAITAVDPARGWQLEGVAIAQADAADDPAARPVSMADATASSAGQIGREH